jgi:tetratricopeptide (TPR) repeat protein
LKPVSEKKRILEIILTALLVIGIVFLVNLIIKDKRISHNLDAGKKCYEDKQYEQAVEYFNRVLDDDNESVEAYYFKTNALMAANDYDSAVAAVEFGYKITKSDVLKELKDKTVIKPESNPVPEEQPAVTNIMPDDISEDIFNVEFSNVDESSYTSKSINLTPTVKIPSYIPVITEVTKYDDNSGTDKNDEKSDKADSNNKDENNADDKTEKETSYITETAEISQETSETPQETEISDTYKSEETSEIPQETEISDTYKSEETSEIPQETEISDTYKSEETSEIPQETEISDTYKSKETSETSQVTGISDTYKSEETSETSQVTGISDTYKSEETSEIPQETEISDTTSESVLLNIDGIVSEEEYEIYESLINKIIDRIIDIIIEMKKERK